MLLITKPTALDAAALAGAEAAHHLATVLRTQSAAFWQRDPAVVLAEIESDLSKTLAIFALNMQASTAVNALLDAISDPRYPNRAPIDLPPYWSFDGSVFTYTAPAAPSE